MHEVQGEQYRTGIGKFEVVHVRQDRGVAQLGLGLHFAKTKEGA